MKTERHTPGICKILFKLKDDLTETDKKRWMDGFPLTRCPVQTVPQNSFKKIFYLTKHGNTLIIISSN